METVPTTSPPPAADSQARREIKFLRNRLYPKQQAAIYDSHRYSVIEASTKAGKTAGCIMWIVEQAITGLPGRNYWWVAPQYGQSKIAFRRLVAGLNKGSFDANESELTVTFRATQTTIWFKSGDNPDALYGEDVYAVVIDEASRLKEDAWYAVRSTITATKGPVRIIGNVKGRKNWFFKLARIASGGDALMAYHKLTWRDAVEAKVLDKAEIDDARRILPEHVFRQNYEAEPADDEGNPFGLDAIRACTTSSSTLLPGNVACWGWDFAKSGDWTVGIGLTRQGGVCQFERWQGPWNTTHDRVKAAMHKHPAPALGDSTGAGDPIVEGLQRANVGIEGYTFTSRSKQQLMENLAMVIQTEAIRIPAGSVLLDELESFEYTYTASGVKYSAPEGMHDDAVCALALAAWQIASGEAQPMVFESIARPGAWFGRGSEMTSGANMIVE
jgi:hypothetical protein